MAELKPCPFCGGEAKIQTSISSSIPKCATAICYCESCGSSTQWFRDFDGDGTFMFEAIEAWNGRVEQNG